MAKKKLDIALLQEAHAKYNRKREADILVEIEGESHIAVIEIDEVFKPSKIRKCIEEFFERTDTLRRMNASYDGEEVMESYLIFLTIKYFTSFPAPDKYKEQVPIIQMMIETGLLYRIYAQFDAKEILKIHDEVQTAIGVLEENTDEYVEMAKQIGLDTSSWLNEEEDVELVEK